MKIFALGLLAATVSANVITPDGFEDFDIDDVLEDPVYKAQFLSFLNETSTANPRLKSALGIDITKRDRELFEPNQVLTQRVDLNAGLNMDLSSIPQADMPQMRKFKHIASLIMYLQMVPILGKYVYYGCYCFTNAQYDLDAGYGKAVDEIDGSCKNFHQCYNCVKRDFVIDKEQANCDGTSRSYRFRGFIDPVTNQKHIECLNDPGSCKRAICECDKKLAMDLRENEFKWNIFNHQKWGGFEKESCRIQSRAAMDSSVADKQCCGSYPNRKPFDLNGPQECCDKGGSSGEYLAYAGECVPNQVTTSQSTLNIGGF